MVATTNAPDSLRELLDSAETEADIAAAEELLDEIEAQRKPTNGHTAEDRWIVQTLAEVADFFRVSTGTVKGWRAEVPPMPGESFGTQGGRYDIRDIVEWRQPRTHDRRPNTKKLEIGQALDEVKLERLRMELAQDQGKLLDRGDVERWAATAIIETREVVMSLPDKLATSSPPELREMVRAESDLTCRAALASLRRRLETDQLEGDVES